MYLDILWSELRNNLTQLRLSSQILRIGRFEENGEETNQQTNHYAEKIVRTLMNDIFSL